MSLLLIQNYYNEVDKLIQYGGSRKEASIRRAFENLLNEYAKKRELLLVPELDYKTEKGNTIFPDGTLKDAMRLDWGYWESKDEADDLDKEIQAKFAKGYPNSNILFEDSQTVVLIQAGKEVQRVQMRDASKLDILLTAFVSFERPEIRNFREAIAQVKEDLPSVSRALRELINSIDNQAFTQARLVFFDLCKQVINPEITLEDINEMLIQHILTEDIFKAIYNESQYHDENNIAQELKKLEITFFRGDVKRNMLDKIRPYYQFIQEQAKSIINHTEKKAFLNAVYEDFYKAYNPKMADKLGVVYTPQEIVKFMIDTTEFLLDKHFNLTLSDKKVEILDPATGTGTFVCALIDKIDRNALAYKYEHEIFANEVSILPYYIANLNIEYTYRQRMGAYKEFTNLCFVDTLDNISALKYAGKQTDFFGFSTENAERIKRQNSNKISVIIGNPPYNAKQENFNDQNANRKYPAIDKRIKETYIKEGSAQNQIVVYDMYPRFYRWATDRLDKNGVICMITNSSFIDGRAFGGFRKCIEKEFDFAYVIDLGGDIRKLSGKDGIWLNEENTIFGVSAAVGIAMMWLVKKESKEKKPCKIHYIHPCDIRATRREKIAWLQSIKSFEDIDFERVLPDEKGNWINLTDNDFESLIPVCSKEVKAGKGKTEAIFELFSSGVKSQRDEWVYDFSKDALKNKMKFFADTYAQTSQNKNNPNKYAIKWDRELENYLNRGIEKKFEENQIIKSIYRPFVAQWFYFDKHFNGMTYQWDSIYNSTQSNLIIAFNAVGGSKTFHCLVSNQIIDLHLTGDSQCLPLYRYDSAGRQVENITDWALRLFRSHYATVQTLHATSLPTQMQSVPTQTQLQITKTDIFHYVYAVLHNPAYRSKYEQNLKRDFPRIPLYDDFWAWATAGKALMDLHLAYETAQPYPLKRTETESWKGKKGKKAEGKKVEGVPMQLSTLSPLTLSTPLLKLKADKINNTIQVDEQTTLSDIPAEAWAYKLGNRSALEWILDQYKESTPSDATIAEKFNTYRFADYKEQVIDLLMRVCTVSVETMKIVSSLGVVR
jgi:predicted helicase